MGNSSLCRRPEDDRQVLAVGRPVGARTPSRTSRGAPPAEGRARERPFERPSWRAAERRRPSRDGRRGGHLRPRGRGPWTRRPARGKELERTVSPPGGIDDGRPSGAKRADQTGRAESQTREGAGPLPRGRGLRPSHNPARHGKECGGRGRRNARPRVSGRAATSARTATRCSTPSSATRGRVRNGSDPRGFFSRQRRASGAPGRARAAASSPAGLPAGSRSSSPPAVAARRRACR